VDVSEEPDALGSTAGVSRRRFVKRAALVGGTLVWVTPVVQSIGSPAMASGSRPYDIADLAVIITCAGKVFRMRWETRPTGELVLKTGRDVPVPPAAAPLLPLLGELVNGAAPLTRASYLADGSIYLTLGKGCKLEYFVVKRGDCVSEPGEAGQPEAGQTGGSIRFAGPAAGRTVCA
jgi:hypothetical protein